MPCRVNAVRRQTQFPELRLKVTSKWCLFLFFGFSFWFGKNCKLYGLTVQLQNAATTRRKCWLSRPAQHKLRISRFYIVFFFFFLSLAATQFALLLMIYALR